MFITVINNNNNYFKNISKIITAIKLNKMVKFIKSCYLDVGCLITVMTIRTKYLINCENEL